MLLYVSGGDSLVLVHGRPCRNLAAWPARLPLTQDTKISAAKLPPTRLVILSTNDLHAGSGRPFCQQASESHGMFSALLQCPALNSSTRRTSTTLKRWGCVDTSTPVNDELEGDAVEGELLANSAVELLPRRQRSIRNSGIAGYHIHTASNSVAVIVKVDRCRATHEILGASTASSASCARCSCLTGPALRLEPVPVLAAVRLSLAASWGL